MRDNFLRDLAIITGRLKGLLEDPEPGLLTQNSLLYDAILDFRKLTDGAIERRTGTQQGPPMAEWEEYRLVRRHDFGCTDWKPIPHDGIFEGLRAEIDKFSKGGIVDLEMRRTRVSSPQEK